MILSEETTHPSILLNIFLYYVRDINKLLNQKLYIVFNVVILNLQNI